MRLDLPSMVKILASPYSSLKSPMIQLPVQTARVPERAAHKGGRHVRRPQKSRPAGAGQGPPVPVLQGLRRAHHRSREWSDPRRHGRQGVPGLRLGPDGREHRAQPPRHHRGAETQQRAHPTPEHPPGQRRGDRAWQVPGRPSAAAAPESAASQHRRRVYRGGPEGGEDVHRPLRGGGAGAGIPRPHGRSDVCHVLPTPGAGTAPGCRAAWPFPRRTATAVR